jgi:DNA-binding CsgD family transcriptional regulator
MHTENTPLGLRISANLKQSQVFNDRGKQFGFQPLSANNVRQAFGFISHLDSPPKFISIDQNIVDEFNERFRDLVLGFKIFLDCRFGEVDSKFLVLLRTPLTRQQVKAFKDMGISGVIPHIDDFDYYLNQRAYEEMFTKGQDFWPRECMEQTSKADTKSHSDEVTLTDRQQEVQKLLCERGLSNKAIARQLNISESTVKIHVSAILKRYGVRNRTQLALAVNNGARL